MRKWKVAAGTLGTIGALIVWGSVDKLELGGSIKEYMIESAAGFAIILLSLFWYKFLLYLKIERFKKSLAYRRWMEYENGIKGRPTSY